MLDLTFTAFNLSVAEVVVAVINRFEFASINGNDGLAKELEFPAQTNEVATYLANANSVVMAEVRNRFEVRGQTKVDPGIETAV